MKIPMFICCSVNIAFRNRQYWEALQASDVVYCDGISVFWGCRVLGNPIPEKLTTTDCVHPIAQRCQQEGLSMYIVGNPDGVAERQHFILDLMVGDGVISESEAVAAKLEPHGHATIG